MIPEFALRAFDLPVAVCGSMVRRIVRKVVVRPRAVSVCDVMYPSPKEKYRSVNGLLEKAQKETSTKLRGETSSCCW
jgi:hypothetical protein